MMPIVIDEPKVKKLLDTIGRGLSIGLGNPVPGQMCVEAAVCYALGLPHGDDPGCVTPALRALKIQLNDAKWSSKQARAKGLRRLAVAQLGSAGHLDEAEFRGRVVKLAIGKFVPRALRAVASIHEDKKHKEALYEAANRCEKEPTREAIAQAVDAAGAAAAAHRPYSNYYGAAHTAACAAAHAAASYSDDEDACAAVASVAHAAAAKKSTRDESLADFAEEVVQILIDMKAPGCRWLYLTEEPPPDAEGHAYCNCCTAWRTWIKKHERGDASLRIHNAPICGFYRRNPLTL